MEKEKLIKMAKKLHQEAFDANTYYLIMQQYKECHSRYINELNISPAFYSVVYEALQKACFMEVAKLYDKTQRCFFHRRFLGNHVRIMKKYFWNVKNLLSIHVMDKITKTRFHINIY